jgi:glycerophosphoryl diester phosphodiesterase
LKIYAHRGASSDFPEMSRAAYMAAIDQGADGFECDLRLTRDGVIVAWHDRDLKRLVGSQREIARSTYSELMSIHPLLTLDEIVDIAIAHKKDLALETKHPVPTRGAVELAIAHGLQTRKAEIAESGIEIDLMSFSPTAVVRARARGIATVFLSTHWLPLRLTRLSSQGPSIALLRKYPGLKRTDQKIFVWTVDTAEDALLCQRSGVDVLITNKPGFIRQVLQNG